MKNRKRESIALALVFSAVTACERQVDVLASSSQAARSSGAFEAQREAIGDLEDVVSINTGRQDDEDNCIDWGKITYTNTIRDILKARCTKCHSGVVDPDGNANGYAVAPKSPYLNGGLSEGGNIDGYSPSYILSLIDPSDGSEPFMPPPQSEEVMSDENKASFRAWVDDYGSIRGSAIPEARITATSYVGGRFRVTYEASDDDSDEANVAIYYDSDTEDFDGTLMQGCLSLAESGRSISWDASELDNDSYYIYVCVFDGDNVTCNYADEAVTKSGRTSLVGGRTTRR